jgi:hypothetical protein
MLIVVENLSLPLTPISYIIASQEKPVEKPYPSQPLLPKQLPDQAGKVLEW